MGRSGWTRTGCAIGLAAIVMAIVGCTSTSGEAAATPTQVDFPATPVGGHATATVTVTNVAASGDLTVDSTVITGPERADFADDFDDAGQSVLPPGQAMTLRVSFDPTATGTRTATLTVNNSGPAPLAVPLSGSGFVPDTGDQPLTATPGAIGFGSTTVGDTATAPLTLTNGGTGRITVQSGVVSGTGAGAFATDMGKPRTLRAGASTLLTVSFVPAADGPFAARLVITHTGTNTPLVVPLSGTATLGPGAQVLYRINAGGPALPGTPVWDADSAAAPSPRSNVATTGTNATATWTDPVDLTDPSVPAGTPQALFQSERNGPPGTPDLAYSFPVPAGTPVEVRLYVAEMYQPDFAAGARVFDVRVDGALARDDLDVFSEVGARKALVVTLPAVSDGAVDVSFGTVAQDVSVKGLELLTTGGIAPPHLVADPTSVALPPVINRVRETGQLTLTNAGAADPLTVTSLDVSGTDATMFDARADAGLPVTLQPGGSTTVTIHFLPSVVGDRTAQLTVGHTGIGGTLTVPLSGTSAPEPTGAGPAFTRTTLAGAGVTNPTSLQFGPDGRLYVADQDGSIHALSVARDAQGGYSVTAAETITQIQAIPNHGDQGNLAPSITGRLVTGILVTGTASQPVIYAVSSDPRIGAGTSGQVLDVDTNSGVLSRLTRVGTGWQRVDLVRGLPRSEENHTGNGLALLPGTSTLLIAYGGMTNMGAPSLNFGLVPEYALSAAVLSVDLASIGSTTYDLPTLDDENRPGTTDAGDPFGGDGGRNQAKLVPGGPVQVYASGFRNPYDLAITKAGQLFTIDNGANAGWGGPPLPDDTTGACTNAAQETSHSDADTLVHIPGRGFYGGHPNPTRANRANTFNPTQPQSPVAVADPVECDYRTEVQGSGLVTFGFSTNGLTEYTASTFGGAMQGDLLAVSFDQAIHRIHLAPDGVSVASTSVLAAGVGKVPLDVTAEGDADPFPGTVWVADYDGSAIVVLEPQEVTCTGANDPALDEDGDGFTNADEIANGTNPCSAADTPPDADGDHISDRLDPDDDNDGRGDAVDPFAVDAANGRSTPLPVSLTWDNDASQTGGLLGLGFTGLMANGVTDYLDHFDPTAMTAGGAAGVVTVDAAGEGDALGATNTQDNGFQLGVDVGRSTPPFTIHTRLPAPFSGGAATGAQSYGVFIGDGSQDNYVKVVVAANDGAGGYAVVREVAGAPTTVTVPGPPAWPGAGGPAAVDLFLRVDPGALTVQASASVDGGAPVTLGPPQPVPAAWFSDPAVAPAVGIISTSAGPAPPFPATWDFLEVTAAT